MKKLIGSTIVLMLFFAGCSDDINDMDLLTDEATDVQLKGYRSGTHDNYFWSFWTDDRQGWVDYQNGSGGNYSVSWDYTGNFTCGKGWSSGSGTRVVGYNIGAHNQSGGGGVVAYYGWTRNPMIEYYVNERWAGSRTTGEHRGSVTTDGATYDIYTAMRYNAPSIDGTQTFRQVFSTRRSLAPVGQNQTITFANHANAWASVGLGLGNDWSPYAIMLTEAYSGSSGYANVTVWSAGTSSGGGNTGGNTGGGSQYYRIQNRATGLYLDGMGRTTNGSDLGQYANTTHENAQWIREASGGYERFKNRGTGLYIDGMGRTVNGENCGQYANTTHVNAQWSLESSGNGYYRLKNRGTGLYMDGYGRTSNGSAVSLYANTTHVNAQWRFVPVQ